MLTHRNLAANIVQVEGVFRCDEGDVLLAVLPYFHIYGLTVNMNFALARGATVVTMARFDLAAFLETIERHRVTRAFLVPPILLALAKHPLVDRHDLSSLDLIVSGAAPLDERDRPGRRRAHRLPGRPGLRADRDQPGDAPPAGGAGHGRQAGVGGAAASGDGVPGRRHRVG